VHVVDDSILRRTLSDVQSPKAAQYEAHSTHWLASLPYC